MNGAIEERLAKIEEILSHLDRQFDELSSMVVEHGNILTKLQAQQHHFHELLNHLETDSSRHTVAGPKYARLE